MIFIERHLVFSFFDIAIRNTLILQFRCLSKLKLKSNDISIFVLNKINMLVHKLQFEHALKVCQKIKNDLSNDQMFKNQ